MYVRALAHARVCIWIHMDILNKYKLFCNITKNMVL